MNCTIFPGSSATLTKLPPRNSFLQLSQLVPKSNSNPDQGYLKSPALTTAKLAEALEVGIE
jgi:hypothetical protein